MEGIKGESLCVISWPVILPLVKILGQSESRKTSW